MGVSFIGCVSCIGKYQERVSLNSRRNIMNHMIHFIIIIVKLNNLRYTHHTHTHTSPSLSYTPLSLIYIIISLSHIQSLPFSHIQSLPLSMTNHVSPSHTHTHTHHHISLPRSHPSLSPSLSYTHPSLIISLSSSPSFHSFC